jgi:FeS assembly SUF system protein
MNKEDEIRKEIITKLKTIYDPEIDVNIYDLGLIYRIEVTESNMVTIDMTLTSPGCPVGSLLENQVKRVVSTIDQVMDVEVNLVFEPPWNPEELSDEVKLELGVF